MDEVQEIAVAIFEEDQSIPLIFVRLAQKLDVFGLDFGEGRIEIVDGDGKMADAGCFQGGGRRRTFTGDDFEE
jgi:hypothetical protein